MNNYEKIKNMSIEEMENFLENYPTCHSECMINDCEKCPSNDVYKWLQQEAQE